MKCINCYREIDDGLKFCPKCGYMQPDDRQAYELDHPELADAVPEDEILEKVNEHESTPSTAITREGFVQLMASLPNGDMIVDFADEGVRTYGLREPAAIEAWYAKCAELIGDTQGFYTYFVKLLFSQPSKASRLLISQVAEDLNLVVPHPEATSNTAVPPPHPAMPIPPLPPENVTATASAQEVPRPSLGDGVPALEGETTVECPICHQHIASGTRQCPYCKQLLDWSYITVESDNNNARDKKKSKRGALWIVLAIIMALLIGGSGYFIYNSIKGKTHIAKSDTKKHDSTSIGPTGNARKDAKKLVNEVIDLMEDTNITCEDDYIEYTEEVEKLVKEYEVFYQDLGEYELEQYRKEIDNYLYNNSDVMQRYTRAEEKLSNQRQNLSY